MLTSKLGVNIKPKNGSLMNWAVLYTKPREERRAKTNLEQLGLTVYVPKLAVEIIKTGVFAVSDHPLFPRYVFVARDEAVYPEISHKLRNVRGVSRVVSFNGAPATVSDEDLALVKVFENKIRQNPLPKFTKGESIRFSYGAFKNVEAIFLEKNSVGRVALLFKMMEKHTRILVPSEVVSKA